MARILPSRRLIPRSSLLSIYLSYCDDHPVLHSFPTRRSSDLDGLVDGGGDDVRVGDRVGVQARGHERSEEHTSELQSRGHLVCRLLLEKKNTTGDGCGAGVPIGVVYGAMPAAVVTVGCGAIGA